MTIKQEIINEIEVLLRFNLETTQEGIKVRQSARPELIEAAENLFNKGLLSKKDGGYLTDLGHEVVEHLHTALDLITSK